MEAGGPPPPRAQSTAWLGLAHQSKASGLQSGLQAHDVQPIDRKLCLKAIVRAVLVELRRFEPLTSAMRSRRRPGVAAPGRCSRQPRARSAFRDPFRHLGLRRIAGRSWKFFVLRAIDRLDDRTAHSADPVADDPDPADFRIGRRASGSRRRARQGSWTDRRGVFLRRIGLFANNATSCSSGEQPTRLSRASG